MDEREAPHAQAALAADAPPRVSTDWAGAVGAPSQSPAPTVRTVWISDLHLGTSGAQAQALSEFLKATPCDRLYLVGDIVDGWRLKARTYWPQTHTDVIRRILTKAKRGCQVTLVTGNHDEFLRRYSDLVLGNITLADEAVHVTADGRRLLIIHGDQYDSVVQVHKWAAVLGDKGYTFLLWFNRCLNRFRAAFGYGYWSLSARVKQRVKGAVNYISAFEDAVARDARRRAFDGVICGHIHHGEIRSIGDIAYYNCGDWVESCTALVELDDGHIELRTWAERPGHGVTAAHTRARATSNASS
jgi:UDP-2,3-diacylglucosamine pyrophosphatase LpxH